MAMARETTGTYDGRSLVPVVINTAARITARAAQGNNAKSPI